MAALTHPTKGSHFSVVQALLSLQSMGVYLHPVLISQESIVHASLSQQLDTVWRHPVLASQLSSVQAILSSQLMGAVTHCPLVRSQVSVVQTLLSLQTLAVWKQDLVQTQGPDAESVVQGLLSSQFKTAAILEKVTVESSVTEFNDITGADPTCIEVIEIGADAFPRGVLQSTAKSILTTIVLLTTIFAIWNTALVSSVFGVVLGATIAVALFTQRLSFVAVEQTL